MSPVDLSPSLSDRSPLQAGVRSRTWDWLLALRPRLNVDLQIVAASHTPLLESTAPLSTDLDSLIASGLPGLRVAITSAIQTRTIQAAAVDRCQTVCVPLTLRDRTAGALVVARSMATDARPERVRGELELVGSWLANAVEAHLAADEKAPADFERCTALARLLRTAATRGSDRDAVHAFIEALAVWHDLEVTAYVESPTGEFIREISLAGADPARTPEMISRRLAPGGVDTTPLSKADIDRFGISAEELIVTRVSEDEVASGWLLVMTGGGVRSELMPLALYLALLDQALARAAEQSSARLTGAVARQLLDDGEQPQHQAHRAIDELQQLLGLSSVALVAMTPAGAPILRIGTVPAAPEREGGSDPRQRVIVRRTGGQYTVAFACQWSTGRCITPQEGRLAQTAADLLELWINQVVRQPKHLSERRASPRSFDQVLERFARQSLEAGVPVSIVVLASEGAVFRPDIRQVRISRLRDQVRMTDLVGVTGEGEIGILLNETGREQARVVAARLQRAVGDVQPVSMGVATRDAGDLRVEGLVEEARAQARGPRADRQ